MSKRIRMNNKEYDVLVYAQEGDMKVVAQAQGERAIIKMLPATAHDMVNTILPNLTVINGQLQVMEENQFVPVQQTPMLTAAPCTLAKKCFIQDGNVHNAVFSTLGDDIVVD